jgi:hypothetical protein
MEHGSTWGCWHHRWWVRLKAAVDVFAYGKAGAAMPASSLVSRRMAYWRVRTTSELSSKPFADYICPIRATTWQRNTFTLSSPSALLTKWRSSRRLKILLLNKQRLMLPVPKGVGNLTICHFRFANYPNAPLRFALNNLPLERGNFFSICHFCICGVPPCRANVECNVDPT